MRQREGGKSPQPHPRPELTITYLKEDLVKLHERHGLPSAAESTVPKSEVHESLPRGVGLVVDLGESLGTKNLGVVAPELRRSHSGKKDAENARSALKELAVDEVALRRNAIGKRDGGGRAGSETFVDDGLDVCVNTTDHIIPSPWQK